MQLFSADGKYRGSRDRQIGAGNLPGKWSGNRFHNLKLRFEGKTITVLVDDAEVLKVEDGDHAKGAAGLITGGEGNQRTIASFDNLLINTVRGPVPEPAIFAEKGPPL